MRKKRLKCSEDNKKQEWDQFMALMGYHAFVKLSKEEQDKVNKVRIEKYIKPEENK